MFVRDVLCAAPGEGVRLGTLSGMAAGDWPGRVRQLQGQEIKAE